MSTGPNHNDTCNLPSTQLKFYCFLKPSFIAIFVKTIKHKSDGNYP